MFMKSLELPILESLLKYFCRKICGSYIFGICFPNPELLLFILGFLEILSEGKDMNEFVRDSLCSHIHTSEDYWKCGNRTRFYPESLKVLIDCGFDLKTATYHGETVFGEFVRRNHHECYKILMDVGAAGRNFHISDENFIELKRQGYEIKWKIGERVTQKYNSFSMPKKFVSFYAVLLKKKHDLKCRDCGSEKLLVEIDVEDENSVLLVSYKIYQKDHYYCIEHFGKEWLSY